MTYSKLAEALLEKVKPAPPAISRLTACEAEIEEHPQSSTTGDPKLVTRDSLTEICHHRRRIKTEEKAKVVASVWGEECIQFFAVLAVLPIYICRTILNNRMNSSFFKSSWCNSSSCFA